MQYTVRNIPSDVDQGLRSRAEAERKSLNSVLIDALAQYAGVATSQKKNRDVSDIAGSWQDDPETEAILEEQRRIDPELWQ